jgi:hypothetical protein
MSKSRVRYVGPFEKVNIGWPPGQVPSEQTWTVEQNHLVPDDVPAKLRDELLQRDDFSEVEHAETTASKKKED